MKNQILHRLQTPPHLQKKDFWLTIVPLLLWLGAVSARPWVIQAHCVDNPQACQTSQVIAFDRPGLGLENPKADEYSDITQQLSGAFAIAIPLAWNVTSATLGWVIPSVAWINAATDLLLVVQTVAWNGALTESTRLFAQRPRPYVYANPTLGKNFSNYTSFYSGHTSFAASTSIALLLTLLGRNAPTLLLLISASLAQVMILSTAAFRVLAGRHFLTDVLVGAVAGTLVALAVAYFHRRPSDELAQPAMPTSPPLA